MGTKQDKIDAERWRALMGSARLRVMGSAGFEGEGFTRPKPNGYMHIGLEIWSKFEGRDEATTNHAQTLLTNYVDFLRTNLQVSKTRS